MAGNDQSGRFSTHESHMTETHNIAWKRVLIEGLAIVVSILLAFGIDAWWEDRQQHASDIAHLQGVIEELEFHKVLLAEATESHRTTVDLGYELFSLLSSDQTATQKARTAEVLDLLFNFYRINAPFGSLQTAISSGAIARMVDVDLASDIASWPTTIDDLLEEQDNTGEVILLQHYALLGRTISMHEVYGHRLAYPTGRGTSDVISDVARPEAPISHLTVDYKDIYDDIEVRNGFLEIMMFGQAALGEATLASNKLEVLIQRLTQCVSQEEC
jgi:hypothetical protein